VRQPPEREDKGAVSWASENPRLRRMVRARLGAVAAEIESRVVVSSSRIWEAS
jgi:hypothetical protein